ncbi:MAG: aspartate 1-decarboxylase [Candidatus Sumerlaeia bacterium]
MRFILKGKIHRATITQANLNYNGSITIDPDLLDAADMMPYEQVHVFDIDNGERLVTYIIEGERGSGQIVMNGAAARKVAVGDKVIILSFDMLTEEEAKNHHPKIIVVDENNKIQTVKKT